MTWNSTIPQFHFSQLIGVTLYDFIIVNIILQTTVQII